jgi:hypothetical protein
VIADKGLLADSIKIGVADTVCDFQPTNDTTQLQLICDMTKRFAGGK